MKNHIVLFLSVLIFCIFSHCSTKTKKQNDILILSREAYEDKLQGFWLGQCIANWTGLVTEMDKVGNIGEFKTGNFYTREDWGKPDLPSIWGQGIPSDLSKNIDFVLRNENETWGADDDTDIEYMYQYLLNENNTTRLTPIQIKNGWLKHIKKEEENFLWVSNQQAYDLMTKGILPPETSDSASNPHYEMIDAQLTTEIFGLYAPANPKLAVQLADLPIRTTARNEAEWISKFYVSMYSLAARFDKKEPLNVFIERIADSSATIFPKNSYPFNMYQFVKSNYKNGIAWEKTRDELYLKYQVNQEDGYTITSKKLYCNGCFAAGINFGASLISLFYGQGDFKETIKIGALAGWDSDNPTATWGGMLGFILGKEKIEQIFQQKFSNRFNIHRTRQNFPNNGIDNFENMAKEGIKIIDRVVTNDLKGKINTTTNCWEIPID